jgi:hypothetical protein
MASANFQLSGFPAANRDATVKLVNQVTGKVIERKPFLDGSLLVRDIDPGQYQLEVTHPNLINAIIRQPIRIFPQPVPTFVPIAIPSDLFKDSPIRDIPDADLGPVQQLASSVKDRVAPLAAKGPGEAIRASDWNAMATAVSDLASTVLQLTNLVSPKGHDHPEIAEKISEVQENLRTFADAFGKSLLQLQREVEVEHLRKNATEVLDVAGAAQATRDRVLARVDDLAANLQSDTATFTQKLSLTGDVIASEVNNMAQGQGAGADAFRAKPEVQILTGVAQQYSNAGVQIKGESELNTYKRTSAIAGLKLLRG